MWGFVKSAPLGDKKIFTKKKMGAFLLILPIVSILAFVVPLLPRDAAPWQA
jgi:hypothetical protein